MFARKPPVRVVVALAVSGFFLVLQHDCKPYRRSGQFCCGCGVAKRCNNSDPNVRARLLEHNVLAELAGFQITATLLLIACQMVGGAKLPGVGYLCIVSNCALPPLLIWFNIGRLKRRKDVLAAFLIEHRVPDEPSPDGQIKEEKRENWMAIRHDTVQLFDPSHLIEVWNAGNKSEHQVFSAVLAWMDAAFKRPVSNDRWCQVLFTLEHLPLLDTAHSDVRRGASQHCTVFFRKSTDSFVCCSGIELDMTNMPDELVEKFERAFGFSKGSWFGFVTCDDRKDHTYGAGIFFGELTLISKRTLPVNKVRVNSTSKEITVLDAHGEKVKGLSSICIPYTVRGSFDILVANQDLAPHFICQLRTGNIVGCR